MNVICVKENEDGSCVVELDMTKEEVSLCLEVGFNKMLKDGLETFENALKPRGATESE